MTSTMNINVGKSGEAYAFTSDWFSMHIPVWTQIIGQINPARVLEIGAYEGRATTWLIENCKNTAGVDIHCIDPWADYKDMPGKKMSDAEARFDQNTAIARKKNPVVTVHKHKKFSTQALAELIAGNSKKFDLIYIDGSHQAPDVLVDAAMSFPLLRVGGIVIFDDYLWHLEPAGQQNPYNMPKPAIDAFLNINQRKIQIIGAPLHQMYVQKISD